MVYDRLFVRHWDSWKDGRRHHVFRVPLAGGEPTDLMAGMDTDCPTVPWGDDGDETLLVAHMALDVGTWIPDFVLEWAQETFAPAPVLNLRRRLDV